MSGSQDDGFESCAANLADIHAMREIGSVEVSLRSLGAAGMRGEQVRRHTEAFPSNSMIHERQSVHHKVHHRVLAHTYGIQVRYSLAPFSETRQAIARFNDTDSKPRPAKVSSEWILSE